MALTRWIPTPNRNYNDQTPYLIHELRETKRQLIEQIEALNQRLAVIEQWCDRQTSDGK